MKYIKNVDAYKDKKKVISARVSEVVVKALEMAKPELPSRFDLTFSYPEIIEKALEDALEEIKIATGGYDFYELEKFKYYIRSAIDRHSAKDTTLIDVDEEAKKVLIAYTEARYNPEFKTDAPVEMVDIINMRRSVLEDQLFDESKSTELN